jgi:hypothetical protein
VLDSHEHRRARPEQHAGHDCGAFQEQPGPVEVEPGHHERDDDGRDHERPEDSHDGQPAAAEIDTKDGDGDEEIADPFHD